MFPTSFVKTQEQHPSYVQEPLEAWPSSFLDPQERSKLLSPAACLFHLCSSVILQFSLSWWKTLCIFGLNNPNHLDMQQTEEMRAEKSGTPHTKVCALPQHHRNLVPFREKCHLWACLLVCEIQTHCRKIQVLQEHLVFKVHSSSLPTVVATKFSWFLQIKV